MIQAVFFALLIIALLAGAFSYYAPTHKALSNPMQYAMDSSGYTDEQTLNSKKTQELNVTTSQGIVQIRKQMDDLSKVQNKFLDTLQDQQQILKSAGKDAADVLLEAKKAGSLGNKDILQLQSLGAEMQDEQRLLVSQGNGLILLNDQVTKSRQAIADQVDVANMNSVSSLHTLQDQYDLLNDQASDLFDKIKEHNQEVADRMNEFKGKLRDMGNIAVNRAGIAQQQSTKDRVQSMLDKEQKDLIRLADSEERSQDQVKNAKQNLTDTKDRLNDLQQNSKDMIEDARQRQEDQKSMVQQRIEDQEQRIQDQQAHENH